MELWIQPKWAKTEEAKKEPEEVTKRRKEDNLPQPVPVVAYRLDGTFYHAFASIMDAVRHCGGSPAAISNCIRRGHGRVGSYQFRKAEVVEFRGERLVKKTPIEPYSIRGKETKGGDDGQTVDKG